RTHDAHRADHAHGTHRTHGTYGAPMPPLGLRGHRQGHQHQAERGGNGEHEPGEHTRSHDDTSKGQASPSRCKNDTRGPAAAPRLPAQRRPPIIARMSSNVCASAVLGVCLMAAGASALTGEATAPPQPPASSPPSATALPDARTASTRAIATALLDDGVSQQERQRLATEAAP